MSPIWVADDEPHPRFTLYSRGNVGEVFPNVLTPLTATLIGDSVARGQLESIVELGALRASEMTGPSVGTGVFGGYLYQNASTMRLFGVRAPGMSVADVDLQVIGDVPGIPPYRRRRGDRSVLASLRVMRHMGRLLRTPDLSVLERDRDDVTTWLDSMPDLERASDEQLLAWLSSYQPRAGDSMRRLLSSSIAAGVPLGLLQRLLERAKRPDLLLRIVGGTGDVDSALPAQRLWRLARMVAADLSLTERFDAGLDGIAERTRGTDFDGELQRFLAELGHRCNDEYELARPSWSMDPSPLYAAIDRLRSAPADRDPQIVARRLAADADTALQEAVAATARPLRRVLRRMARLARSGGAARERAKDILVLENLGARRVLHELARRAATRGGPDDPDLSFFVTFDELPAYLASPTDFDGAIAARRATQQALGELVPPDWFEGRIPDPSTWRRREAHQVEPPAHGTVISGIGASAGRARGPARVVLSPDDPRGLLPGDVLVCHLTDPSWTPLFLAASAVVCDTGALLSHAAIVARELGIPAVMSVPAITRIADGTMLTVDGVAGEVVIG